MGFETYVLAGATQCLPPLRGKTREGQPLRRSELPLITPCDAAAGLASGTLHVVDLRSSQAHRAGHPAGAEWAIRPRLATLPLSTALPRTGGRSERAIVLLADEPAIAELAGVDLRELGHSEIWLLDGGMPGWVVAGL